LCWKVWPFSENYVNYFRELADLSAQGRSDPEENLSLMLRYVPHAGSRNSRASREALRKRELTIAEVSVHE
jgi:hypothetical protein